MKLLEIIDSTIKEQNRRLDVLDYIHGPGRCPHYSYSCGALNINTQEFNRRARAHLPICTLYVEIKNGVCYPRNYPDCGSDFTQSYMNGNVTMYDNEEELYKQYKENCKTDPSMSSSEQIQKISNIQTEWKIFKHAISKYPAEQIAFYVLEGYNKFQIVAMRKPRTPT